MAHGLDAIGRSPRLDDVASAVRSWQTAALCQHDPMQYAIASALTGDRIAPGQASGRRSKRARDLTIAGCVRSRRLLRGADGGVLRDARA